jgi:glutamate-1-semialdehyde 2,1-aminomutase
MDKEGLLRELINSYQEKHPKSATLFNKAKNYLIRGGSHNLRLFEPYPFFDVRCQGSRVYDVDGHSYVDFWQGHFANILGHNPKIVIDALKESFEKCQGLTTGFPGVLQKELAEIICKLINAEKMRFTTAGALATMYSIMMAKTFTKREFVLKAGGGWHGANPYVLKGISTYNQRLNQIESAGLSPGIDSSILVTRFNDIDDLREIFRTHGDRIACFILEPFIGAGGFLFAEREYLAEARKLTKQFDSLLIFDEVISGFRFHPGGIQTLFGIEPDMTVMGKVIGGGMPVSAVAGKEEILELCSPGGLPGEKVKFEGGTFSAHPASMLAGITYIKYLVEHAAEIYPRIGKFGEKVRKALIEIFSTYGFNITCTGDGDMVAPHSSVVGVHFLKKDQEKITSPEQVWNPELCDIELRERIFKLAMLNEGFFTFHGFGGISYAHNEEEIKASLEAVERIARHWQKFL